MCVALRVISVSHAGAWGRGWGLLLDESYMDMLKTSMLGNNETQWSEEYEHTSSATTPLSHARSLMVFLFTTHPPLPFISITRPLSSSLISLRRCAAQRRGAYLWCEHACIITHLPRAMEGSGGATDSAGTVADCAWKQRRPGLIRLSSRQRGCWQGSEVGWWESTKLAPDFALCLCVCGQRGGQNGRESESLQPHRPTRAYTPRNKLTQANKCW